MEKDTSLFLQIIDAVFAAKPLADTGTAPIHLQMMCGCVAVMTVVSQKSCLREPEQGKAFGGLETAMPPETIYSNDAIYCFLIYYFLEDLPSLETDDRWTLSHKMASWLPYEKNYSEILQKIENLLAAASNGKTDA